MSEVNRARPKVPHAEARIIKAMGNSWVPQFTFKRRGSWFQVDLAHLKRKIVIEADGKEHRYRIREKDKKRDAYLRSKGWRVFRFTNEEILSPRSISKLREFITTRLKG